MYIHVYTYCLSLLCLDCMTFELNTCLITEPTIRMSILDTVSTLLDHHPRLCQEETEENSLENEERLCDVPVRMVSDINQQVRWRERQWS